MGLKTGWTLIIFLTIVVAVLAWFLVTTPVPNSGNGNATTPIAETTPFISENVKIFEPLRDASVPSTFTVRGEARGTWYFEASFPVQVRDRNDNVLVTLPAQADGEWMTTDFVPFSVTLSIQNYSGPATLILLKDNPSGLPENDDSVSIPITIQ